MVLNDHGAKWQCVIYRQENRVLRFRNRVAPYKNRVARASRIRVVLIFVAKPYEKKFPDEGRTCEVTGREKRLQSC